MEPNAYFRQHYALEPPAIDERAFRPYWRIRPRLDQLLLDGAITIPMWQAGNMFRTAAELVIAQNYPSRGIDPGRFVSGNFAPQVGRRIDAKRLLRATRAALGNWRFDLLELHLVDDLGWSELGRCYGVHAKTVRRWTIDALKELAKI